MQTPQTRTMEITFVFFTDELNVAEANSVGLLIQTYLSPDLTKHVNDDEGV